MTSYRYDNSERFLRSIPFSEKVEIGPSNDLWCCLFFCWLCNHFTFMTYLSLYTFLYHTFYFKINVCSLKLIKNSYFKYFYYRFNSRKLWIKHKFLIWEPIIYSNLYSFSLIPITKTKVKKYGFQPCIANSTIDRR